VPPLPADARLERLAQLATDTPELVVDLAALRANIARIATAAAGRRVSLRPHIKTHKAPRVAQLQLDAGAVGIQVAKLGEAEVMADAGVQDILVGYPIVGEAKLARLVALASQASITVSVDSHHVSRAIAQAAHRAGVTIGLLIEVDTGLHRIGVPPGQPAVKLAEQVAALDGVELRGVLTHEGHVYTRARDEADARRLTHEACQALVETARLIRERGLPTPIVSVGSAATFRFAIEVAGVTEVRPGTYVFNDRTQMAQGAAALDDVAAVVVATIVSGPHDNGEVVVDAGSKALTSDQMIVPQPPPTFGAVPHSDGSVVRLSEEHAVIKLTDGASPSIGDRLAIIPNHICPVVNLFDRMTVVEGDRIVDTWMIAARGKLR
jgi:D-serine deaminase-like pyridoxal phosphate-dependent protein